MVGVSEPVFKGFSLVAEQLNHFFFHLDHKTVVEIGCWQSYFVFFCVILVSLLFLISVGSLPMSRGFKLDLDFVKGDLYLGDFFLRFTDIY